MDIDHDLKDRLGGKGLLTTEILYYRPDCKALLQTFTWQTLDTAPKFPRLVQFLDHWRREVKAAIHSISIAHADWVGPAEIKSVDEVLRLN